MDFVDKLSLNNQGKRILSVSTAELRPGQQQDVAHLNFPRVDYVELQRMLGAVILDYSTYNQRRIGKFLRFLETQLHTDLYIGTLSWWKSQHFETTFTWSERAGIPFSFYKRIFPSKGRLVSMFQCWSERQKFVIKMFDLFSAMDEIVVHCTSMQRELVRLGALKDKVNLIHYSVDQSFFSPLHNVEQQSGLIISLGEPRSRDYGALFQAVDGLPVMLHTPAYGHWYAREKKKKITAPIPENVSLLKHLSSIELRNLYAQSQFVVLPINDLIYSAGATVTLEASCMARPVIAFHSKGISDYIINGETGILVEPGNINALRDAIQFLIANPKEAKRLGDNARQRIIDELNFETYVTKIANLLLRS